MIRAIVGPFGICPSFKNRVTVEGDACHCFASVVYSTSLTLAHSLIVCASRITAGASTVRRLSARPR